MIRKPTPNVTRKKHLILSDKLVDENKASIPMALAIGAINSRLVELGIRGFTSINVQTGEILDTHSFAVLLGVGATTINSYIAFDSIYQRYVKGLFGKITFEECIKKYIKSWRQKTNTKCYNVFNIWYAYGV